jgi:hypothetical protein
MSNERAKDAAASIRAEGFRARLDTWQGQFAVWSDKGLTDPTMPPRSRRVGGGRRPRARRPTLQAAYDKLVEANKAAYPLQKFKHDGRWWGWHGAVWTKEEADRKIEAFTKQGYDVAILRFRGSNQVVYISKWKDGKISAKPEELSRLVGASKKKVHGVITLKRKGKTVTYKDKKWNRFGCHININDARKEATKLSDQYPEVRIFTFKNSGLYCVYIRGRIAKPLDATALINEVFTYLDKLHKARVDPAKYESILVQVYGMNPTTAKRLVSRWSDSRKIREKPPTHPGRRRVSKGVYGTKAKRRVSQDAKEEVKGKPSKSAKPRRMILLQSQYKQKHVVERMLGIPIDRVVYAREFGKGNVLTLVKIKKQYRIYENKRNTRGKRKGKIGERKLVDKFSVRTPKDGVERAFRRELARRGVE